MKHLICFLMISFGLISQNIFAQGTAGEEAIYESRYIVDMPNAGVLEKGGFSVYTQAYNNGGILLEFSAAPFTDFNMGLSFSGTNIIGYGGVKWQGLPGVHLRYRIFNETKSIPAFLIGISTQGRGSYSKDDKRFVTPSPGIFLALSKNYKWALGTLSFHGGINYSFEPAIVEKLPNLYAGLEQSLGTSVSFNLEFNSTLNDANKTYMKRKVLLNTSLRWSLAKNVTIELQARDLFQNITMNDNFNRTICLEYINLF
jgi:hypothetical protein